MWSKVSRPGGVSLIAAALLLVVSGSAAGHDDACELGLRQAPIEDVPPLPGWTWREVVIAPEGWRGSLEWSGGDLRKATFAISCVADPAGLFERRTAVRSSVWDEAIEVEDVIGQEAAAWRSSRTATTHLEWHADGVLGEIVGEWNTSVAELAAVSQALEAARSSGVAVASQIDH